MVQPLMPKATAVWLIEKTSLSFDQIADFVQMHPLEVQAIADGEWRRASSATTRCRTASYPVRHRPLRGRHLRPPDLAPAPCPPQVAWQGRPLHPVSKRQDKPDGIAWLLRNHPEMTVAQIGKLLGTTKETIEKVRDKRHLNSANIKPRDPVILGLCTQSALNVTVAEAQARLAAEGKPIPAPVAVQGDAE
jgi:hypothetical protein